MTRTIMAAVASIRDAGRPMADSESPFCTSSMPMDLDDGAVDERVLEIGVLREGREDPLEDFLAHLRKRCHTELHLLNCGGRSRHGAPARTIHNTASRNSRLSSPERPGSPSLPGRSGQSAPIARHSTPYACI